MELIPDQDLEKKRAASNDPTTGVQSKITSRKDKVNSIK